MSSDTELLRPGPSVNFRDPSPDIYSHKGYPLYHSSVKKIDKIFLYMNHTNEYSNLSHLNSFNTR